MAPKKQKAQARNAFFYFLLELQQQRGRHIPGGLRQVAEIAGPMWERMDERARKPFEDKAKRDRSGVKYTTQGDTFEEVEQGQRAEKEKQDLMLRTIKDTLIQLGRNTGFAMAPFFFVHMNYFCKKDDGTYYPAEFALTKFSVAQGVDKVYHTMVNLSDLPQGYTLKATEHSRDTHRIPLPPNVPDATTEYSVIMDRIEKFVYDIIDEGEPMPPLYTKKQFVESTENIMSRWAEDYGRGSDYFRIFPLEQLFFDMKMFGLKPEGQRLIIDNVVDNGFIFYSVGEKIINDDTFSYRPNIACHYHEEQDCVHHCSKSYVKRWGWMFANNLCLNMDIDMIPGAHCPAETAIADLKRMQPQRNILASNDEWQQPPSSRKARTEQPPSRAFGRGVPMKPAASLPAAMSGPTVQYSPVSQLSGSRGPLLVTDHGASAQNVRAAMGRGAVPRGWNTNMAAAPGGDPPAAAQVVRNGETNGQFEDVNPRHTARVQQVEGELRKPKTTSLAMQLESLQLDSGAAFSSDDFPAFGRGGAPSGRGRRGGSRGSRGGPSSGSSSASAQ